MTSEAKKSIKSAAGVLMCLGALILGAIWRDRLELGPGSEISASMEAPGSFLASKTETVSLPETRFFEDVMELLKRKYVDPIPDDMTLADGSVRGMLASLGDPNSLYMDADQYRVYDGVRHGKYEGIGADLILTRDKGKGKVQIGASETDVASQRIPRLQVATVVPGSSADRAGLKPGDWVEFVDDHWVPNSDAFDEFAAMSEKVRKHQATSDAFLKMRDKLRSEAEKNILPIKARDRLMMGSTGEIRATFVRDGRRMALALARGHWELPGFEVEANGIIRLPFVDGVADKLREAISGKSEATIDLRNNVGGDFDTMLDCLKTVAPKGVYGYLVTAKQEKPTPLTISGSNSAKISLTLLVDQSTRGAAAIFAKALESRGIAKLQGGPTGGNLYQIQWTHLLDGAGYTLVLAEYKASAPDVLAKGEPERTEGVDR